MENKDILQKRIEAIRKHRKDIDKAEQKKAMDLEKRKKEALLKIKALAPRLKELFILANTLIENRIPLGTVRDHYGVQIEQFVTESIEHEFGFFVGKNGAYAIGYAGGGCCGEHFAITPEGDLGKGNLDEPSKLAKAETFCDVFETFEKDFLAYVDSQ